MAGCSVLYHALACARLALLPAVWDRERVPRRSRAQLREWWETYVAAAQHSEALTVGDHQKPPRVVCNSTGWFLLHVWRARRTSACKSKRFLAGLGHAAAI